VTIVAEQATEQPTEAEPVFEEPGELKTAHDRLLAVMNEIQFLRKSEEFRQTSGGNVKYKFRGVDAVMNAVGPLLRKYRILPKPMVQSVTQTNYTTSGGTQMVLSLVHVRYELKGPGGPDDFEIAEVYGEAADSSDKSVTQALSVAYRTLWLELLCIPTDDQDPDSRHPDRGNWDTTAPEERPRGTQAQARQRNARRPTHDELIRQLATAVEGIRVLRGETVAQSNARSAKYCKERHQTDIIKSTDPETGEVEIELSRLSEAAASIFLRAIAKSVEEIEHQRAEEQSRKLAISQEV
jgi:hypothetical protein